MPAFLILATTLSALARLANTPTWITKRSLGLLPAITLVPLAELLELLVAAGLLAGLLLVAAGLFCAVKISGCLAWFWGFGFASKISGCLLLGNGAGPKACGGREFWAWGRENSSISTLLSLATLLLAAKLGFSSGWGPRCGACPVRTKALFCPEMFKACSTLGCPWGTKLPLASRSAPFCVIATALLSGASFLIMSFERSTGKKIKIVEATMMKPTSLLRRLVLIAISILPILQRGLPKPKRSIRTQLFF